MMQDEVNIYLRRIKRHLLDAPLLLTYFILCKTNTSLRIFLLQFRLVSLYIDINTQKYQWITGELAQSVEHVLRMHGVAGSIPAFSTLFLLLLCFHVTSFDK